MRTKISALAVCLLLLLCACAREEAAPFDRADVDALLAADIFSEPPEEVDSPIACALFGIDQSSVTGCAVYLPTSTNAEALALFVVGEGGDVRAVEDACRAWTQNQAESYGDYAPEHVPKLEGAVLQTRGNTVLLVVGSDPDAAQAAVDALGG